MFVAREVSSPKGDSSAWFAVFAVDGEDEFQAFEAVGGREKAERATAIANAIDQSSGYDLTEVIDRVMVYRRLLPTVAMINRARVQAGLEPIDPTTPIFTATA